MRITLVISFILSVSFIGYSQLGYMGKRVGIEIGVGSNNTVFGNSYWLYNYTVERDLLLPKLNFGLIHANRTGTVFRLAVLYSQLPNSHVSSFREGWQVSTNSREIDTIWTASENIQWGLGIRKYYGLAPLGMYYEFQWKTNFVFNRSLRRSETQIDYLDNNYSETVVSYDENRSVSIIPEFGFSLGTSIPLGERSLFEFGGNLNFAIGRFRDKQGSYNMIPEWSMYNRIVSSRKVFTTNILEVYARFILFP